MRYRAFFESFRGLHDRSPQERLSPCSRYVIVSDLGLGDGRNHDRAAPRRDLVEAVLGAAYLPEGYTLVLNGDAENLRSFWSKDIAEAWRRIFALLDEFAAQGSLRRLLGERDLGLVRKARPRYRHIHGLRLLWREFELFVLHGHQACRFFAGRDYRDFVNSYIDKPRRIRDAEDLKDPRRLHNAELRLYRASRELGIATIFGHTGRTLFESRTRRDELRASMDSILAGEAGREGSDAGVLEALLRLQEEKNARFHGGSRDMAPSLATGEEGSLAPCLFNAGRAVRRSGLNLIEIEGGALRQIRWTDDRRPHRSLAARSLRVETLEGCGVRRHVLREVELDSLRQRLGLPARPTTETETPH